ncbi:MAG TPA: hypothetical protein DCM27_06330 [Rhodospirillaceae bacterium]|nr:hypothetical protein [Rhodospirillaceae bacterium]
MAAKDTPDVIARSESDAAIQSAGLWICIQKWDFTTEIKGGTEGNKTSCFFLLFVNFVVNFRMSQRDKTLDSPKIPVKFGK